MIGLVVHCRVAMPARLSHVHTAARPTLAKLHGWARRIAMPAHRPWCSAMELGSHSPPCTAVVRSRALAQHTAAPRPRCPALPCTRRIAVPACRPWSSVFSVDGGGHGGVLDIREDDLGTVPDELLGRRLAMSLATPVMTATFPTNLCEFDAVEKGPVKARFFPPAGDDAGDAVRVG